MGAARQHALIQATHQFTGQRFSFLMVEHASIQVADLHGQLPDPCWVRQMDLNEGRRAGALHLQPGIIPTITVPTESRNR